MSAADDCRRLLGDESRYLDEARQALDGVRAALRRRDGLAEALRLQEALARASAERGARRAAWRDAIARRGGLPPALVTLDRVAAGLPAEVRSEVDAARRRLRARAEEVVRLSLRTAHLVRALARAFDGLLAGGATYGPAGQPRPHAPGPIIDARG